MKALKDPKKFGKGKKPKNRRCKKFGISLDKELRKMLRKEEAKQRDDLLHRRFTIVNDY